MNLLLLKTDKEFFTQIPQATHSVYHFTNVKMTEDMWHWFSDLIFVLSIVTLLVNGKAWKCLRLLRLGT